MLVETIEVMFKWPAMSRQGVTVASRVSGLIVISHIPARLCPVSVAMVSGILDESGDVIGSDDGAFDEHPMVKNITKISDAHKIINLCKIEPPCMVDEINIIKNNHASYLALHFPIEYVRSQINKLIIRLRKSHTSL